MSILDNKKIGLFLLVAGFLLVSCGTSRKQAKALSAKPVAELTRNSSVKYDYFFWNSPSEDSRKMMRLLICCSIAHNINRIFRRPYTNWRNIICSWSKCLRGRLHWTDELIRIIGTVRDWRIFINRTKEKAMATGRYVHTFHRQAGSALCLVGHL